MPRRGDERVFASWTKLTEDDVQRAGRPARVDSPRIAVVDALIVAVFLLGYDLAVLVVGGVLTSAGGSLCTEQRCDPDPRVEVHRAVVGIVVFAVAAAAPVLVAAARRRGVLVVTAVQAVAAAVLLLQGVANLDTARANLNQICTAPPAPVRHECPPAQTP